MERNSWDYLIVLIGGLVWLLFGIVVFGFLIFDLWGVDFIYGDPEQKSQFFIRVGSALYISVMNTWVVAGGFWMMNDYGVRRGAKVALILGALSLNIIAVVGGILGLHNAKNEGIYGFDFNIEKKDEKVEERKVEQKESEDFKGVRVLGR